MDSPNLKSRSLGDRLSVLLATGCYISLFPTWILNRFSRSKIAQSLQDKKLTGAGLFGSLQGAATYYYLPTSWAHSWWSLGLGVSLAIWASHRAEKVLASHDDSRIVVDEWIGAWLACWGVGQWITIPFILAVVFFRLFDVMKGPLGRRLQNFRGGWGVCLDDIYAGLAANLFWRISVGIFNFSH